MCDCDRALELISLGLDGALTAGERQELDEHLASCGACRSLSEELAELHEAMPELAEEVPEGFCEAVMERVRAEKVVPMAPPGRGKKSPWRSWAAMAAVFAVVMVGAGTAMHGSWPGGQENGSAQAAVPEAAPADAGDAVLTTAAAAGKEALPRMGGGLDEGAAAAGSAEDMAIPEKALETTPGESFPTAEPEGADRAITTFSMPGIMAARAPVDGEAGAPSETMLEECAAYLESGALENGDAVDTTLVSWAPLTAEELEQVRTEEGTAEQLDPGDLVVTLGDTAGEDYVRLVCDSETGQVLGYLPSIKNDP